MRTKSIGWFEGKISQILSRNPDIQDIHELAIQALYNQRHSELNEFYLEVAIANLRTEKRIIFKKKILKTKTLRPISLAA